MFIELNVEVFRVLKELEGGGCYVISTASPTSIIFIDMAAFERAERVVAPESFSNSGKADSSRYQLIQPLLEDEGCIMDRGRLFEVVGEVAEAEGTTKKRILAACVFAAQFYSSIGFGLSLDKAFRQAKAALLLEGIPEENTPHLFLREDIDSKDVHIVKLPDLCGAAL